MARETIIFCDPCLAREERSEGTEHVLSVDPRKKPRALALCDTCKKELLDPLEAALMEHGQVVDTPVPAAGQGAGGKVPCGICGKGLKNMSTLQGHVRNQHQITWPQYQAEMADRGDLPQQGGAPAVERTQPTPTPYDQIPDEFKCTECDTYYDPALHSQPKQAIGMHLAKKHGIRGKSRSATKANA